MSFPIAIKDVLPVDEFVSLQDELKDWRFTNGSLKEKDKSKTFFGQSNTFDRILYYRAATTILLKIKKHIRKDLKLIRLHSNGSLFGSYPEFHVDFSEEANCFTFVLFTNTSWDTNWGGEFAALDPVTHEYRYVPYIPNTGALIPSHWEHIGTAPSTSNAGMRTSIAFVFTLKNTLNEFLKANPHNFLFT